MIHQRLRIYDERTGNPAVDNRNRRRNRQLQLAVRNGFRVQTPGGRRRKKIITRIEYEQYARVVAEVAEAMAEAERRKRRIEALAQTIRYERRPIVTTRPL